MAATSRTEPLNENDINERFEVHLPYLRSCLLNHVWLDDNPQILGGLPENEKHRIRISTYESGGIVARRFMGLGIRYNPLRLNQNRRYYEVPEDNNSYEEKIVDLGGDWVDPTKLKEEEQDLLARIYLIAHRASAHLTHKSPYQGEWKIFNEAILLIDRLLKEHLYKVINQETKIK